MTLSHILYVEGEFGKKKVCYFEFELESETVKKTVINARSR